MIISSNFKHEYHAMTRIYRTCAQRSIRSARVSRSTSGFNDASQSPSDPQSLSKDSYVLSRRRYFLIFMWTLEVYSKIS